MSQQGLEMQPIRTKEESEKTIKKTKIKRSLFAGGTVLFGGASVFCLVKALTSLAKAPTGK
jgi:hypothetical protein